MRQLLLTVWCILLQCHTGRPIAVESNFKSANPCSNYNVPIKTHIGNGSAGELSHCRDIEPYEILSSMKWLISGPSHACTVRETISGFPICEVSSVSTPVEAELPRTICLVYIVHGSCEGLHSVSKLVEHWLNHGCTVRYIIPNLTKQCINNVKKDPLHRRYAKSVSFHKKLPIFYERVDILYLEDDRGRGLQALSALYSPQLVNFQVQQFSVHLKYGCANIKNSEFGLSRGWALWALQYYLRGAGFKVALVLSQDGDPVERPNCFSEQAFSLAQLNRSFASYRVVYLKDQQSEHEHKNNAAVIADRNVTLSKLINKAVENEILVDLPSYCQVQGDNASHILSLTKEMYAFILQSVSYQCPDGAFTCRESRTINVLTPCLGDIARAIAEDYAWSRSWCNIKSAEADIMPLQGTPSETRRLKEYLDKRAPLMNKEFDCLLFCVFVHNDPDHLKRLLNRIYTADHLYVIIVDAGSSIEAEVKDLLSSYESNVITLSPQNIIYKTSAISRLTAKFLSWALAEVPRWHYVVFLTGADYPLIPLSKILENLRSRRIKYGDRMPKLLSWEWSPKFQDDFSTERKKAIRQLVEERHGWLATGRGSHQFGIPLTCGGQRLYARFPIRIASKESSARHRCNTQWLFNYGSKTGRISTSVKDHSIKLPPDGVSRFWAKSDPATTSAIDRLSAEYIVHSDEGKKYYHFFKYTLVGAEEHYFISLLSNWNRTSASISADDSIPVFNTWALGRIKLSDLKPRSKHEQNVHTSYLGEDEMDILRGLSQMEVFFARKFSSEEQSQKIQDIVDVELLGIMPHTGNK